MEEHFFASYKSGAFAIDVSNFKFDSEFVDKSDIPAFVHEYCHYIQDMTTISSIFGFSLWMRDIAALTSVFSNGENETIDIPLARDAFGETINKFRKYYNLYCGDPDDLQNFDLTKLKLKKIEPVLKEISLDGKKRKLMVNKIKVENPQREIHFGLIALQEIHAYYAQQLSELRLNDVNFNVNTSELPSYPYKFGDFLFDSYKIKIDIISKYVLVELCLDTVQAPSVFLEVIQSLKGKTISFTKDWNNKIIETVENCSSSISWSKKDALDQILPDLKEWSNDPNRKYLSQALKWYIDKIELALTMKKISQTIFTSGFYGDWNALAALLKILPPPIYLDKGVMKKNYARFPDENMEDEFEKSFEAASTIWSHRILYELLVSESTDEVNKKCKCPLYEGCIIKEDIGEQYTCATAPWEIIKNEKKIICPYGMASHSFGLWQNTLNIV